ncbi:hypothetical protein HYX17_05510 [Candidatus Woesearchaeota archaeon]|nr:hypothetical protein [Candidatus Woesearchaeota archaeon]
MKSNPRTIDFKKRNWVVYGASGFPAFITPFAVVPSRHFFQIYRISNDAIALWKDKTFDFLYDGDQLNRLSEKILSELLKEKWKYYNKWKKTADKFDKFHYELIEINFRKLNNKDLIKLAKKYYGSFKEQFAVSNVIEPLSFYFQNNFKKLLIQAGLTNEEASKLEPLYGNPAKNNYIKECIKEYNQLKDKNKINSLLEKYHYINNDYCGPKKFSKKDLLNLVFQHKINNENKILKTKNTKAQNLLDLLQVVATIQDVRKAESLMWVSGADLIINEFARRINIKYETLLFATFDEIISGNLSDYELERRKKLFVIVWSSNGVDIYLDQNAEKIFDSYKKDIIKDSGEIVEIKGTPASPGKAKGRVKIVLNVSQFNKIKKGDILVTMMTRPEYLPIMGLASAFVTDEGGISSHAAIISREMKKPCIIGTRIATKVLKDGDLIEVDANKGIIKIIGGK